MTDLQTKKSELAYLQWSPVRLTLTFFLPRTISESLSGTPELIVPSFACLRSSNDFFFFEVGFNFWKLSKIIQSQVW